MIRNLRTLGVAFVAVFAMSAVAASAAHATEARFTCGKTLEKNCEVTVEADPQAPGQVFVTNAGTITCNKFHAVSGSIPDGVKQSSVTLTGLEYSECEFAGLAAKVTVSEGCHYTLTSGNTEIEPEKATGNVTLAETAGKACVITIKSLKCEVTVKATQLFENAITYENKKTTGIPEEITANATTGEKIKYTTGGTCIGGAGNFENGKFNGKVTARAFELNGTTTGTQTDLTLVDA